MDQDEYFEELKQRFGIAPEKTRKGLSAELEASTVPPTYEEILERDPDALAAHLFASFQQLKLMPAEKERVARLRETASIRLLKDEDIEWLANLIWRRAGPKYLFAILARFWQDRSEERRDHGYLTRASSCWREAEQPSQAIACLSTASRVADKRLLAIIHTCRAAALKDLYRLPEAKAEAEEAVSLNRDQPHPYNVLGAIAYLQHQFQAGADYFQQAEAKGQTGLQTRRELEQILNSMSPSDKQAFARHLLEVNTRKNAWVSRALRSD